MFFLRLSIWKSRQKQSMKFISSSALCIVAVVAGSIKYRATRMSHNKIIVSLMVCKNFPQNLWREKVFMRIGFSNDSSRKAWASDTGTALRVRKPLLIDCRKMQMSVYFIKYTGDLNPLLHGDNKTVGKLMNYRINISAKFPLKYRNYNLRFRHTFNG